VIPWSKGSPDIQSFSRKLEEIEALRDKLVKQLKKYERN
jgi:hypothetical protein